MHKKTLVELKTHTLNIRKLILSTSAKATSAHIASCLSSVDLLVGLYFDALILGSKKNIHCGHDRFILSKGHGGLGLYATLAERKIISKKLLEKYGQNETMLAVHPVMGPVTGIEATTGSLGHGLGMGLGMALAQKRDRTPYRSFVLLSDGECDEGSTWEAVMLAGHLKLDNLIAIIDYNKIQSFGNVKDVLGLEPFADKWRSNNWEAVEIDGHDLAQITSAFWNIPIKKNKPTVVIAHTIKGKGVRFMENNLEWHYLNVKIEDLEKILKEVY